jgi:hypothetical protein
MAQIGWQTSTDGTGFMDSPPKTLKATLQTIRDLATNALNRMVDSQEEYSTLWKCKECKYIKHFTSSIGRRWQMS